MSTVISSLVARVRNRDIDRWMAANFKFGYSQDMKYKNLLEIDGQDYWTAHIGTTFLLLSAKDGKIQATPGNAICKPVRIDIGRRVAIEHGLHIPSKDIIMIPQDRGELVSLGAGGNISAKVGDTILFQDNMVEKYVFEGQNYWVLNIAGCWQKFKK
jgi:hypothetical protein